jgi:KAP family P-loop domain
MWRDSESEHDFLNFTEVADQIATLAKNPSLLPISIGVFGSWGTGKSTVLQLVEAKLPKEGENVPIVVRFDAWMYQGFDDARAALMEAPALAPHASLARARGLRRERQSRASSCCSGLILPSLVRCSDNPGRSGILADSRPGCQHHDRRRSGLPASSRAHQEIGCAAPCSILTAWSRRSTPTFAFTPAKPIPPKVCSAPSPRTPTGSASFEGPRACSIRQAAASAKTRWPHRLLRDQEPSPVSSIWVASARRTCQADERTNRRDARQFRI